MKRFPHYIQLDAMDCGPSCLRMIAKYYARLTRFKRFVPVPSLLAKEYRCLESVMLPNS